MPFQPRPGGADGPAHLQFLRRVLLRRPHAAFLHTRREQRLRAAEPVRRRSAQPGGHRLRDDRQRGDVEDHAERRHGLRVRPGAGLRASRRVDQLRARWRMAARIEPQHAASGGYARADLRQRHLPDPGQFQCEGGVRRAQRADLLEPAIPGGTDAERRGAHFRLFDGRNDLHMERGGDLGADKRR